MSPARLKRARCRKRRASFPERCNADFLEFQSISKGYPGVQALSESPSLYARARFTADGRKRAGKSTLIRVLSGDQAADTGEIRIDGEPQHYRSVRDAFNAGVIVIHQELQLVSELTVAENLWLGRFPAMPRHRPSTIGSRRLRQA